MIVIAIIFWVVLTCVLCYAFYLAGEHHARTRYLEKLNQQYDYSEAQLEKHRSLLLSLNHDLRVLTNKLIAEEMKRARVHF